MPRYIVFFCVLVICSTSCKPRRETASEVKTIAELRDTSNRGRLAETLRVMAKEAFERKDVLGKYGDSVGKISSTNITRRSFYHSKNPKLWLGDSIMSLVTAWAFLSSDGVDMMIFEWTDEKKRKHQMRLSVMKVYNYATEDVLTDRVLKFEVHKMWLQPKPNASPQVFKFDDAKEEVITCQLVDIEDKTLSSPSRDLCDATVWR